MIVYPDGADVLGQLLSRKGFRAIIAQRAFQFALVRAIPSAALAAICHFLARDFFKAIGDSIDSGIYSSLYVLVSFLVVFRTNLSNQRFLDGTSMVYTMHADFVEAASLLVAFSRNSRVATRDHVANFQHTVIRLISMLGAACMIDLAGSDDQPQSQDWLSRYAGDMIDIGKLDPHTLVLVEKAEEKAEAILHVVQHLMTGQVGNVLDAPAPLLTRAFQELGNGMIKYQEAVKLVAVPTPYPYMIVTDALALVFTLFTPLAMAAWSSSAVTSCIVTFIQVFILWSLTQCSAELDNPFGKDLNDLNMGVIQASFNKRLVSILKCCAYELPEPFVKDIISASEDIEDVATTVGTRKTGIRAGATHRRVKILLPGKNTGLGLSCDPDLVYFRILDQLREACDDLEMTLESCRTSLRTSVRADGRTQDSERTRDSTNSMSEADRHRWQVEARPQSQQLSTSIDSESIEVTIREKHGDIDTARWSSPRSSKTSEIVEIVV